MPCAFQPVSDIYSASCWGASVYYAFFVLLLFFFLFPSVHRGGSLVRASFPRCTGGAPWYTAACFGILLFACSLADARLHNPDSNGLAL